MTTIYEYIYASLAVVMAGFAVILFIKLVESIKDHADTAHELTKVKEELKKEKEAQTLEIQTRQFRIAEERKVQKFGTWFSLSPQVFISNTPTDQIEMIIRNETTRRIAESIKPYIEIGMDDFPDSAGYFRFKAQLSVAIKEPKHIDFSEAFRMVGQEWRNEHDYRSNNSI